MWSTTYFRVGSEYSLTTTSGNRRNSKTDLPVRLSHVVAMAALPLQASPQRSLLFCEDRGLCRGHFSLDPPVLQNILKVNQITLIKLKIFLNKRKEFQNYVFLLFELENRLTSAALPRRNVGSTAFSSKPRISSLARKGQELWRSHFS